MQVKRYDGVAPSTHDGGRAGVTMREMITASDGGADVRDAGVRSHPRRGDAVPPSPLGARGLHVNGSGVVKSEQGDRLFAAGDTIFIPGNELHCFVATTPVQFVCVIPSPNVCAME